MEERTIFFVLVPLLSDICFHCEGQFSFPSKTATQSTTYVWSTPDRAIDGNPNTCSVAAIAPGSSAFGWWQVDLGDTFTVYSVTVTSGTDGGSHPGYLQNFTIYVGDTNSTDVGDLNPCYNFNNGSFVPSGVPLTLNCSPNPLNGRYVTIKRRGGARQDAIGLCEVNIKYYIVGYIYIRYLPTNQTSGYTDEYGVYHGSNLANDWNLQTCSYIINPSGTPKWYIDLQDFYAVTSFTAFNQDSNANFNSVPRYLAYFNVRVGNSTDLNSQTQCCYYGDAVPVGGNVTCTCQSSIIGRYISIERTGGENPQALVVCEVLVQGYKANVLWTSTTSSTTSNASSTSITMSLTTTTKLTSLSTAPQSLSAAVQTISSTGSSALIPPSTLPTTSTNETSPMNAGSVAAVVLGILFGMCLAAVVILTIYNVRLRRQNKPNIYATNAAIAEPQRDYEMLRTLHESQREVEPAQIESKITESIESPYEEVTIAASSI